MLGLGRKGKGIIVALEFNLGIHHKESRIVTRKIQLARSWRAKFTILLLQEEIQIQITGKLYNSLLAVFKKKIDEQS